MAMVFAGGTALAGLILVFLGSSINAFDSYGAAEQAAVRGRFRLRALIAIGGLLSSLLSAGMALLHELSPGACSFSASLLFISLAGLLLLALACLAVSDLYG